MTGGSVLGVTVGPGVGVKGGLVVGKWGGVAWSAVRGRRSQIVAVKLAAERRSHGPAGSAACGVPVPPWRCGGM